MWWECWNFQPHSGGEKGWNLNSLTMVYDLINCACIMKPHVKTLNSRFRELPVHWTKPHAWSVVHPDSTRTGAPALEALLDLVLCTSSSGCTFSSLIHGHQCKFLSYVCHSSKLSDLRGRRVSRKPQFCSQPGRSAGTLRAPFLAGVWSWAILWNWALNLWSIR